MPSGTLWATMNVGAESETDYGLYFAWGETTGYSGITDTKKFNVNDYLYYDAMISGANKYNGTDGKTSLDASDDSVVANWGGDWHMPDLNQIEELTDISNCTSEWVENYKESGINGRLLTSLKNNGVLFVPAAGYCDNGSHVSVNDIGVIWGRSVYLSNYARGRVLGISTDKSGRGHFVRCYGCSVRGVLGEIPIVA